MTCVYLALLGRRCFLKCCTFYFMHLLGSRSLDWSWRRRRSARCQRQPLFCLPLGRVRGQFEGRWTDSFSRGSRGFGDCRRRVHEPLKRDLSAHPLVLQWCSPASGKQKYIVVAFNVRKPLWDMVMFQLEPLNGHNGLDCPFVLELEGQDRGFSLQSLRSDMEFCMDLAREASDWLLFLLKVGKSLVPLLPFGLLGALRWTDILWDGQLRRWSRFKGLLKLQS